MLLALGAVSSAIDALQALTSSKPPSPASQDAANLFAFSADASATAGSTAGSAPGGGASISPETMSALLAAQSQSGSAAPAPMSRSDGLKDLFAQIDADGDGKITKSEFEDALGAGGTNLAQADDVFSKLDNDRASASGAAASSYNFIEQMIAREAKAISLPTTASLSVSV